MNFNLTTLRQTYKISYAKLFVRVINSDAFKQFIQQKHEWQEYRFELLSESIYNQYHSEIVHLICFQISNRSKDNRGIIFDRSLEDNMERTKSLLNNALLKGRSFIILNKYNKIIAFYFSTDFKDKYEFCDNIDLDNVNNANVINNSKHNVSFENNFDDKYRLYYQREIETYLNNRVSLKLQKCKFIDVNCDYGTYDYGSLGAIETQYQRQGIINLIYFIHRSILVSLNYKGQFWRTDQHTILNTIKNNGKWMRFAIEIDRYNYVNHKFQSYDHYPHTTMLNYLTDYLQKKYQFDNERLEYIKSCCELHCGFSFWPKDITTEQNSWIKHLRQPFLHIKSRL